MALIQFRQKWDSIDNEAVARLQDVAAGDSVVFNGTLATPIDPSKVSFLTHSLTYGGFTRNISITSLNDLSGTLFTITGTQNGVPVITSVFGPNNATVYSFRAFDVITSITVDIDVAGVQIGTGTRGYLPIIKLNAQSTPAGINYAIQCIVGGDLTYRILWTAFEIVDIGMSLDDITDSTSFLEIIVGADNTSNLINFTELVKYLVIEIESTQTPDSGLFVNFMQI